MTSGHGLEKIVNKFEKDLDDYKVYMVKVIADRLLKLLQNGFMKKSEKKTGVIHLKRISIIMI